VVDKEVEVDIVQFRGTTTIQTVLESLKRSGLYPETAM